MAVQWLGVGCFYCQGLGSTPWSGTKTLQATVKTKTKQRDRKYKKVPKNDIIELKNLLEAFRIRLDELQEQISELKNKQWKSPKLSSKTEKNSKIWKIP